MLPYAYTIRHEPPVCTEVLLVYRPSLHCVMKPYCMLVLWASGQSSLITPYLDLLITVV